MPANTTESPDKILERARKRGVFKTNDFRSPFTKGKGEKQAIEPQKRHILDLELVVKMLDMAGVRPAHLSSRDFRELRRVLNDGELNMHPYSSKSANVGVKGSEKTRSRAISDSSACKKVLKSLKSNSGVTLTAHEADHITKQPAVFRVLAKRSWLSKELLRDMVAAYFVVTEKLINTESIKYSKGRVMDQRIKDTRLKALTTQDAIKTVRERLEQSSRPAPPRCKDSSLDMRFAENQGKDKYEDAPIEVDGEVGESSQQTHSPPRCKDSSLDMRFAENQGKDKYENAPIEAGGEVGESSQQTHSPPRCKDGSLDMRFAENQGKDKNEDAPIEADGEVGESPQQAESPAFDDSAVIQPDSTTQSPPSADATGDLGPDSDSTPPRCQDGSLDMRFAENQGKDKFEDAPVEADGEVGESPQQAEPPAFDDSAVIQPDSTTQSPPSADATGDLGPDSDSTPPRCQDGSLDMRFAENQGKDKFEDAPVEADGEVGESPQQAEPPAFDDSAVIQPDSTTQSPDGTLAPEGGEAEELQVPQEALSPSMEEIDPTPTSP